MITWTTRNTVVSILAALCIIVPVVLGALDGSGVIHGSWITPLEAALGGMLVGLVTPGSPVGRVLDLLWPPKAGASAPVTPDVAKAIVEIQAAVRATPETHPTIATAITNLATMIAAPPAPSVLPQPPLPPPVRVPPSREGGFASIRALLWIVLAAGFGLAGYALLLPGCGASAIRAHAIAAHAAVVVETAGGATIESATTAALAACPHDDGDTRTHCVATVAGVSRAAASVHDVLGPATLAYRAATLTACGADPSAAAPAIPDQCPPDSPPVIALLEAAAAPVEAALPTLIAALRALATLAGGH